MSERDHYPAGVPCWVDTAQPEPEAAVEFYGQLFGWDFAGPGSMPTEPPGSYYVARLGGRDVAGVSSTPPDLPAPGAVWNTYVAVDSADTVAQRAADAGGAVLAGPFDAPPAGRMAVLTDPAGAPFCAWHAAERQGAQLVNEPGAWAMSVLHTDAPDPCRQFYRALFGWEAEPFGEGAELMRLNGYVGGEPQQPVPRDVVAVMAPLPDGAPPHWSVDFWVHDADGAAAKADQLGGRVLVEPHDVPGFRSTALADPQGAVFSASQLMVR
jgi:predicted enzyme related to lactoylglutathione lyase